MATKLSSHIDDIGIDSDVALMKDIYEVLDEAEQQRQPGAISHATRFLVELLTRQVEEEVVPWECESAVCQSAYRLLEAVEDWHKKSDAAVEPEAVREVLLTVHGNLTKLLARRPAKTSDYRALPDQSDLPWVYRALPERGHQDERPCQVSEGTWVHRSLSEQGQQDERGLLSGDPWEGCDDIAAEDLFEWFAESLAQSSPAEAAHVPVVSPSSPLRVLQAAKLEAKERPSCSSRISTVSTAASLSGFGRSCVIGSPTPSISSASSTGTGPSERRLASLSVGSDVMINLRSRPSLSSSIGLSAKRSLAALPQLPASPETRAIPLSTTSPPLPALPKTRAIPSSPNMSWRELQVFPALSDTVADELKQSQWVRKPELGDRKSRELQEPSTLEVYEAALDDWEEEFLIRAPLHDWEEEFLRRAAHG